MAESKSVPLSTCICLSSKAAIKTDAWMLQLAQSCSSRADLPCVAHIPSCLPTGLLLQDFVVILLLLSTAIIKQMLNRLKIADVSPVVFFNHIWDLSSTKSGLFNWPKFFLDSQNPFLYIIIQKKWMSATTPFAWKITQEALGSMTVSVSQDKVRGCICSWQQRGVNSCAVLGHACTALLWDQLGSIESSHMMACCWC